MLLIRLRVRVMCDVCDVRKETGSNKQNKSIYWADIFSDIFFGGRGAKEGVISSLLKGAFFYQILVP